MIPDFNSIRKNLKKDASRLKPVKVAILTDSSTQFIEQGIKGVGFSEGFAVEIYSAPPGNYFAEIFNKDSGFNKFGPEYVFICVSVHSLVREFINSPKGQRKEFQSRFIGKIKLATDSITKHCRARIIIGNLQEGGFAPLGNFHSSQKDSFLTQVRMANMALSELAHKNDDIFLLDINRLSSEMGYERAFSPAVYYTTSLIFSLEFLPVVCYNFIRKVGAMEGKIRKCIVLDLDNTLWGGIIGDDGIEGIQIGNLGIGMAFSDFQLWLKELKNCGIILTVCSKNNHSTAIEPFLKHPEMILKEDDFAVFIANWESKAGNIKAIRDILNIGYDSMVFIDDSTFERNSVRMALPEIIVPEMPDDPADYVRYLSRLNLFETTIVSSDNEHKTEQYRTEGKRAQAKSEFNNEQEFLRSLKMEAECQTLTSFNIPRVAQLTQRSNQFNVRTVRYTESDLTKISKDQSFLSIVCGLKDIYGDYGIIAFILIELRNGEAFIDSWLMSCRVLGRSVTEYLFNKLVDTCRQKNIHAITGEIIETKKNELVRNLYHDLGFENVAGLWKLDIQQYKPKDTFIK